MELFAIGIYGCLVTLVFCIVDKTINNYPKIGQSVALPSFNRISQDALTNLIQENFFFISGHLSAPRKNNTVSYILLPVRENNLWLSRVKFETIVMKKSATTMQSSNVN